MAKHTQTIRWQQLNFHLKLTTAEVVVQDLTRAIIQDFEENKAF